MKKLILICLVSILFTGCVKYDSPINATNSYDKLPVKDLTDKDFVVIDRRGYGIRGIITVPGKSHLEKYGGRKIVAARHALKKGCNTFWSNYKLNKSANEFLSASHGTSVVGYSCYDTTGKKHNAQQILYFHNLKNNI